MSGIADEEFDAADIDREIIAARLQRDVLEHSGKVHLFVADAVRPQHTFILYASNTCGL